ARQPQPNTAANARPSMQRTGAALTLAQSLHGPTVPGQQAYLCIVPKGSLGPPGRVVDANSAQALAAQVQEIACKENAAADRWQRGSGGPSTASQWAAAAQAMSPLPASPMQSARLMSVKATPHSASPQMPQATEAWLVEPTTLLPSGAVTPSTSTPVSPLMVSRKQGLATPTSSPFQRPRPLSAYPTSPVHNFSNFSN
ncbi:unnamed protein product, partial [Polarella glacialis]